MRREREGRTWTEMDGVNSVAVQGHHYGERQFTDAQRRSGRGFAKNDKSRSWGRRDNEQRQREKGSVCLCVKGRKARREMRRKKMKFCGENFERRGVCKKKMQK